MKELKHIKKIIFILLSLTFMYFLFGYLNSAIGWYGYEKWKFRRDTNGNINDSKRRNVFIKKLDYNASIKIDSFYIYIERGFKFGANSDSETKIICKSKYPYQVSFIDRINNNKVSFYIINREKFDSVSSRNVFLKNSFLKDNLLIGVESYNKKWDSIGCIKVWDKDFIKE